MLKLIGRIRGRWEWVKKGEEERTEEQEEGRGMKRD